MELHLPFKYQEIVADAGYESEENYLFLEGNGQMAYIKPQNYEISKTRKYHQDIRRMENMEYDEKADCYYCKKRQALAVQYEKQEKDSQRIPGGPLQYIEAVDVADCPYKTDCIKGNNCRTPMEDRQKSPVCFKKMKEKRQEALEADYQRLWDTASDEPEYPGEGSFANI